MKNFRKILSKLRPENFTQLHPEGLKAVISHRKYRGGMGFTQSEVQNLITLIDQSLIMEEAIVTLNT